MKHCKGVCLTVSAAEAIYNLWPQNPPVSALDWQWYTTPTVLSALIALKGLVSWKIDFFFLWSLEIKGFLCKEKHNVTFTIKLKTLSSVQKQHLLKQQADSKKQNKKKNICSQRSSKGLKLKERERTNERKDCYSIHKVKWFDERFFFVMQNTLKGHMHRQINGVANLTFRPLFCSVPVQYFTEVATAFFFSRII